MFCTHIPLYNSNLGAFYDMCGVGVVYHAKSYKTDSQLLQLLSNYDACHSDWPPDSESDSQTGASTALTTVQLLPESVSIEKS